eukprot:TRINITY_DN235_c0_g1_i4.p1 TRINITY_DN235_c0_g1~~TRINITY_DN235_c0_g1_i4.p1  ORF type:complete len:661 (-),score=144.61 TRINITY_DN235_c0_g1_i4:176-2158(-)
MSTNMLVLILGLFFSTCTVQGQPVEEIPEIIVADQFMDAPVPTAEPLLGRVLNIPTPVPVSPENSVAESQAVSQLTQAIEQDTPQVAATALSNVASQEGGLDVVAQALNEEGAKGNTETLAATINEGLKQNTSAIALSVAEAIASNSTGSEQVAQAASQAVAQSIGGGDAVASGQAIATLAGNGGGVAASQAIAQASSQGDTEAVAESLAQAISINGAATAQSAAQAISDSGENSQAVAQAVAQAVSRSIGVATAQASAEAIATLSASGASSVVATAVASASASGSGTQAVAESLAQAIAIDGQAVATSAAQAITDSGNDEGVTQAVSEAVVQAVGTADAQASGSAIATLSSQGGTNAVARALSQAVARSSSQAVAQSFARAFALQGSAVAQSASQAIAESDNEATAEVVAEAVAESVAENPRSAGQGLGTLCQGGQAQIAASANALSKAVGKGQRDSTAEAFAEAIGSVSTDTNNIQAVAQSGAQALTKDGNLMAEVLAKAVIQSADGGYVEATAVAIAEIAASENGSLFVEAIAVAVLDLGDGCQAIAEAISRAEIIDGQIGEVEALSTVEIVCEPTETVVPSPPVDPQGPLVSCDSIILRCIGLQGNCCNGNMVPGETCTSDSLISREYRYVGYCIDAPNRMLVSPVDFGFDCYCDA